MNPLPGAYNGPVLRSSNEPAYEGFINSVGTITLKVFIDAGQIAETTRYQPIGSFCTEDDKEIGLSASIASFRCVPGDAIMVHPFYDAVDPVYGYTDLHVCSLVPIAADDGGIAGYIQLRRLLAICEGDTASQVGATTIDGLMPTYTPCNQLTTDLDSGIGTAIFSVPITHGGVGAYLVPSMGCEWMTVGANSQTQSNASADLGRNTQYIAQRRKT